MSKKDKEVSVAVRLPESLLAEARRIAPRSLKRDPSRLLEHVLQRWVEERKEHLMDLEITRMGKDPKVIAECRKINREFEVCDGDGL
jgi:hypothetical protein